MSSFRVPFIPAVLSLVHRCRFACRPAGAYALASLLLTACTLPSSFNETDARPPAEQAADAELRRIEDAQDRNGSIPRWRYENLLNRYPGTPAAYEANLILARKDFSTLNTQRASSASRQNLIPLFTDFVENYGFGSHSQPADPAIAEDYRRELHPLLYDALVWLADFPLQYRYIERYPGLQTSARLRETVEKSLTNPELRWRAIELLDVYALVQPTSPNIPEIQDRIELNLVAFIDQLGTRKDCDRFLERFPDSQYAEKVRSLRNEKVL